MTLYNLMSRRYHRTSSRVDISNGFIDIRHAKAGPKVYASDSKKFVSHGQA